MIEKLQMKPKWYKFTDVDVQKLFISVLLMDGNVE
ncbi:hypothetical protein [Salmonella phage SD-6_S16]|nr:hypothetical protein [Salmonella phage SD-6_S16]